ncbi:protein kinase domain-containing protein [Salinibacterium sp. PAMC 21357]|uniref:protein kinase domain-containing protein n=1 Tax=Salinibacterium sp. PAMC 21357 TaxID=1112215 RepID=UPI002351EE98|nr:protein kinase [Salinibacterium sp. PAMC 21357]
MSARYKEAPLSLASVLDTSVRMAAALETAHRSGLLHRDIKPSNILITTLGTPVLADFGIAMSLGGVEDTDSLIAMSVPWSSPEALQESTTGTVASEVWSLGATIYTLLAGHSPFATTDRAKDSHDQLRARIYKAAYTPLGRTDVPMAFEQFLARTMSRDPAKRPISMLAFAEEVRWMQYELGLPPTTIEVAAAEWAAAAPVSFADNAPRGPVLTTVNKNSRRATRAQKISPQAARRGEVPAAPASATSPMRAAIIGGVIGATGLLLVGALVLWLTGVIG